MWMESPSLNQMVVSVREDEARLDGVGREEAFRVMFLPDII